MASKDDKGSSMKIMLIAALILSFVGGYLVARARYKPQIVDLSRMVVEKDQEITKLQSSSNKVMMMDGKLIYVQEGVQGEMTEVVVLSNGDKVMTDGKVVRSDGSEFMLNEGESIGMDGVVVKIETESEN